MPSKRGRTSTSTNTLEYEKSRSIVYILDSQEGRKERLSRIDLVQRAIDVDEFFFSSLDGFNRVKNYRTDSFAFYGRREAKIFVLRDPPSNLKLVKKKLQAWKMRTREQPKSHNLSASFIITDFTCPE